MASTSSSSSLPTHHRALVQETYAAPPIVKSVPIPPLIHGSAILSVLSAPMISYMPQVYDGTRKYPYPNPLTLGTSAIARVAAVGPDATHLQLGMLVYFDCLIRSRDRPAHIFLSAIMQGDTQGSAKLMREVWRDGSFAEFIRVPLENVFVLDETRLLGGPAEGGLGYTPDDLAGFFSTLVPYGGLADVGVKAGETVIVAPATGGFGGAAVNVALAMGAGRVVAMGRNEEQLGKVVQEGGGRVVAVKMTGNVEEEVKALQNYGEADVFFDISPPHAWESTHFKAGILALRQSGRASLMGGQLQDITIPIRKIMHNNITLKGTWMYQPEQIRELIKMVESGILRLGEGAQFTCVKSFALDDWKKAFEIAPTLTGKGYVVFRPSTNKA